MSVERNARVKTEAEISSNQRVRQRPDVLRRILKNIRVVVEDR